MTYIPFWVVAIMETGDSERYPASSAQAGRYCPPVIFSDGLRMPGERIFGEKRPNTWRIKKEAWRKTVFACLRNLQEFQDRQTEQHSEIPTIPGRPISATHLFQVRFFPLWEFGK